MFHNFMGYITNIALATFVGFLLNVGMDFTSLQNAVSDPYGTDWTKMGQGVVQAGVEMQNTISPFIEGPVADFTQGIRQGIVQNQQQMIQSNAGFAGLWSDRLN